MNNRTKLITTVLSISAFIMLVSFSGQKAEWKGTIEEEDGVKVIKNPEDPLYGEIEFELELDLSFGGEDLDEKYNFIRPSAIEVDKEGNIFIIDFRLRRIQKYDKDGNYLQTIGREGQGPGEFRYVDRMFLDDKERLHVMEMQGQNTKIHIFDKNGGFIRSLRTDSLIWSELISEENLLGLYRIDSKEGRIGSIILMDSEGNKVKTIASFLKPWVTVKKKRSVPRYSPYLYFSPLSDELGIYGYSSEYKLFVVNSSGAIVYIIEKEEKRIPTSRKEEREYLKERIDEMKERGDVQWSVGNLKKLYKFAKYKPFFTRIITDDKGHIFLQKPKSLVKSEQDTYFDLFNQEGYYLYKVKIHEIIPREIKNGYVYRIQLDPDTDYYMAERYKIKNWDQIKKEK